MKYIIFPMDTGFVVERHGNIDTGCEPMLQPEKTHAFTLLGEVETFLRNELEPSAKMEGRSEFRSTSWRTSGPLDVGDYIFRAHLGGANDGGGFRAGDTLRFEGSLRRYIVESAEHVMNENYATIVLKQEIEETVAKNASIAIGRRT